MEENKCPLGGDSRECFLCAYYPDFAFNPITEECEVNDQEDVLSRLLLEKKRLGLP